MASSISVMRSSSAVTMPQVRGTARTLVCEEGGSSLRRHSSGMRASRSATLRAAMEM